MKDIIIIGGGTAGLTAAIYVRRAGKTALILEGKVCGGQIVNTPEIENYPGIPRLSGAEFAQTLQRQAVALGAELVGEQVTGLADEGARKVVYTASRTYCARAVILAVGAKHRPLGLAREEALVGRGVSYCAACDGMFYRDQEVVVNGGGNTALSDAAFLSNCCKKVTVVHRRATFRGDAADVDALRRRANVAFLMNAEVTALLGEPRLTAVEVADVVTGARRTIPAAGLFIAIGHMPDTEPFRGVVELDGGGYILAGEDCKTSAPGIYAAGDCRTKAVRQLTTAAADGSIAALASLSPLS